MAKVPYYFETPIPTYFRENGWFENEHMFKFIIWAFSRCQTIPHTELKYGREIHLAAYEFIAGRLSSPKECFLSENIFRNQINQLLKAGLLVRTTNSLTNKYTCYLWMVERFTSKNIPNDNQQNNQQITNRQPTDHHKVRRENISKEDHPSIPSNRMTDEFFFENEKIEIMSGVFLTEQDLATCLKIKGTIEEVKRSIEYIQNSKRRKHPIVDWPNALEKWRTEDRILSNTRYNSSLAEKLCAEFEEYKNGRGWRCYIHHHKKKDQQGILFEHETGYQEAHFVAFANGDFQNECDRFIKTKNMRKKC